MENNKEDIDTPDQLVFGLAKNLANNLGVPVFVGDNDKIKELYEGVITDEKILENITENELYQEVSDFYIKMNVLPPNDEDELTERIKSFFEDLKTEKINKATIIFNQLFDLPIGTKFGDLELIEPDSSIIELNEYLKELEKKDNLNLESCSWGRLIFKSFKTKNLEDILFNKLELQMAILSLIMNQDLDVKKTIGIIESSNGIKYFLSPLEDYFRNAKYVPQIHGPHFKSISAITNKEKPSKLEQKILQSIKIYGLSRLTQQFEIRFLMLISSCESLLLSKNDRDYLGLKLAEKTAFLLGNDDRNGYDLFKYMKKLYTIRSNFTHSGVNEIKTEDVRNLDSIFKKLIFKLLELSTKYDKMEQKSHDADKVGVEDYLDNIKFNIHEDSIEPAEIK